MIQFIKSWLACWYAFFDFFDSDLDKYDVRLKDWNTKPEVGRGGRKWYTKY